MDLEVHAKLLSEAMERFSHLPTISRICVAGDYASMPFATERYLQTRKHDVAWLVGSYARIEWAVNNFRPFALYKMWPQLWIGSDPDDTNLEYLEIWRKIPYKKRFQAPLPDQKTFTIYRGQIGDKYGISWTFDKRIAENFALTGGLREAQEGGKVLKRRVKREKIIAYLTQRGESELIVEP